MQGRSPIDSAFCGICGCDTTRDHRSPDADLAPRRHGKHLVPLDRAIETCARHDLWPATDEARDAEADLIASAVPGASLALVGPGDPQATFAPVPGEDLLETYPAAVANEFFSDRLAAELRASRAPSFETSCGAGTVQ